MPCKQETTSEGTPTVPEVHALETNTSVGARDGAPSIFQTPHKVQISPLNCAVRKCGTGFRRTLPASLSCFRLICVQTRSYGTVPCMSVAQPWFPCCCCCVSLLPSHAKMLKDSS